MAKKSTTQPLIDFKREVSTRPMTISLKISTCERLQREVAKGSVSQLIDMAINKYLDDYARQNGGAQ
jgi:hypothetical protein